MYMPAAMPPPTRPQPGPGAAPPQPRPSVIGWTTTSSAADAVAVRPAPAAPSRAEGKSRRGADATAAMLAHAGRLGMLGPLGEAACPDGASEGNAFATALEASLVASATLAYDTPRTATALSWLEEFLRVTGRTMYCPARGPHAEAGQQWNRRSNELLTKFITTSPPLSRTRGEHVSQDVAQSYSNALCLLRSRQAGYDIAPPADGGSIAKLDGKTTKRKEPPKGERALSSGMRAAHLEAAAAAGFERSSVAGATKWGAAIGSHNLLLRGGEIGEPDNARPDPRRILRCRHFSWRRAALASRGRPWLLVWVIPIKDPQGTHRGYPTPVARRHDGRLGDDPLCPYDALALVWWMRGHGLAPFPVDALGRPAADWWLLPQRAPSDFLDRPMFSLPGGGRWLTSHSRSLFREVVAAAGGDASSVGGKAARVGGSTDARERTGDLGKHIIQRRGRWGTDVAEVYQRELLAPQLELSMSLGDAAGEDLEQLCAGWAQPAAI